MKFILFVLAIIGSSLAVPFAQNEESALASREGLTFKDFFAGNESDTDSERIVGGLTAPIQRFPWQISISNIFFTCAGALISETRGLTLASCVHANHDPSIVYRVIAGSTSPFRPNDGYSGQVRPILHPLWRSTRRYNIAVLVLFRPVPLGPTIRPIALPQQNAAVPYGVEGLVSGWGTTNPASNSESPVLRYTVARALTNQQCNQIYGGNFTIPEDFVCASAPVGGRGPCRGDTGNPLVVNGVLIGLVADARGCGQANAPAIYTRVSYLVDWIRTNL